MFIVQCGELTNYENFPYFKLMLFPNSLMEVVFTWYATTPRNSIMSWQQIKRQFHKQFLTAEPEVCIVEFSWVTQRIGETTNLFIVHFKRIKNRCKIQLSKIEYVVGKDYQIQ